MAFEVFDRKTAGRTKNPALTIQRKGIISLNGPAVDLLVGTDKTDQLSVDLLYDQERKIIGIRRASTENPNPHLLRRQGSSRVYLVTARMFSAHYGIDTDKARRFAAKTYGDKEHQIVGACLDDPFVEVGRKVGKDKGEDKKEQSLFSGIDKREDTEDRI